MISVYDLALPFRNSTFKPTFVSRSIRKSDETFVIEKHFYQFFTSVRFADFSLICIGNKNTSFPMTFPWDPIFISFRTFSNRLSLKPFSLINSSVRPRFHPNTFRFTINPLSIVDLPVWKQAFSFLHLRIRPLTLENRAIFQCLCPMALCFTFEPFSFVD